LINGEIEEILAILRVKKQDLVKRLAATNVAIKALEDGYDLPEMKPLPKFMTEDRDNGNDDGNKLPRAGGLGGLRESVEEGQGVDANAPERGA